MLEKIITNFYSIKRLAACATELNIVKELYPVYLSTGIELFIKYDSFEIFEHGDYGLIESMENYSTNSHNLIEHLILSKFYHRNMGAEDSKKFIRLLDKYDGRKYFCIHKLPDNVYIGLKTPVPSIESPK